ncbi:hypothetical protein RND81_04G156900 [Saponaria officinalis]|uniref:Uncharacterized protein n=1 Tax=Saponaria officinalis TaxID=3572 RepID=A0AAW1LLP9_SAPOF
MKGGGGMLWLFFIFLFTSSILCATSRIIFSVSEENAMEKPRMLRGISLNDYDDVSANLGHDPRKRGSSRGGRVARDGGRRKNP